MGKAFGRKWLQNSHIIAAGVDIVCETERGIATNPIAYLRKEIFNGGYTVTLFWNQPYMVLKN